MRNGAFAVALILLAATIPFLLGSGASVVSAAPVVGSGDFDLDTLDETENIYTNATPVWAGVSVSVTQGQVQVESVVGEVTTILGTVGPGCACVFEGEYTLVRLRALAPSTGTYVNRRPTDVRTDPDHAVGGGTAVLPGSPMRILVRPNATARVLLVRSTATSSEDLAFTVRSSETGENLVAVLEGNSTCLVLPDVTELWLVGIGPVTYELLDGGIMAAAAAQPDVKIPNWEEKDEEDEFNLTEVVIHTNTSGTQCFSVEIENTGTKTIVVRHTNAAGEVQDPVPVLPGNKTTVSCANKKIWLTAHSGSSQAKYTVTAVTAP